MRGRDFLEAAAQIDVGRDATGHDQRGGGRQSQRIGATVGEDIAHRALEGRAEIGDGLAIPRRQFLTRLAHGRLESGEREVAARLAPHRPRQRETLRIASDRRLLDRRAAGKAQAQQLGGLVETLAGRIVDGGAEPREVAGAAHRQQLAMAARHKQQQIGKRDRLGQAHRQRMPFEMIDGDERLVVREGQRLGGHDADHHAADQPRPARRGDAVEIGETDACLVERLRDQPVDPFEMRARGDLRHDTTVNCM